MTKQPPQHCKLDYFPIINGQLQVGDLSLSRLAQRVGQTPFYAYDRQLISQRVATLREQLPSSVKLHYAIKANPMPALVNHLAQLVDGLDVASVGEMRVALDTSISPIDISFAGPGKRAYELKQAIAAGVVINVESDNELSMLHEQCNALGVNAKIAVRINPSFELKSAGMHMGGNAKPFGIDEAQVPAILQRINTLGLDFQGLHIYSGSQCLKVEAIAEAQANSFRLAIRLSQYCKTPIKTLNIGGGFGIPYFPGDIPLDLNKIGAALHEQLQALAVQLPTTTVVLELGRYLVGEAGIYVAQIIDKKTSQGQVFLITDGGLHHHLAASGNFGQVVRKNYPVAIGNKMTGKKLENVNIVGSLCTPLDILAHNVLLPEAEIGDLVVIYQSGAYGYSASPEKFLSHPPSIEVLV